jgi:SWI/SNF-related matrix-associated actin-dependent regulator of chromatin subfamily A3
LTWFFQDANVLLVEGSLAGQKGTYDCPIALRLFGTSDPIGRAELRRKMKSDKLPVEVVDQRESEAKVRKAEELKKMQAARNARGSKAGNGQGQQGELRGSRAEFAGSSFQGESIPVQNLEDIMQESLRVNPRDLGVIVEKLGMGEDFLSQMPMAPLPERLATKLLPYQRQALAWLLEKENPELPPPESKEVVQLWKRSERDSKMFTNIATNFSLMDQLPTLARGGILAVSRQSDTRLIRVGAGC